MKRHWMLGILSGLIFILLTNCSNQDDSPVLKGPYLGQKPPGMTPELFAPGIVSTGLNELNSVFSPDGKAFYFCVSHMLKGVSIFEMKMENEEWTKPTLLPFASRFGDIDVTLSPDGERILFSSRRPVPGSHEPKEDNDFWMAERKGDNWGEAVYLGDDINADRDDYYPMMTNSGTIYFSSQREGPGTNNIYMSKRVNGKYSKAVKLDHAVNTEYREFDPYVSPDEQILIFTSNRPEGFGSGDLYISFKQSDGRWTKAKNMGDKINTPGSEYCAMLSPDGKYIFFTGARRDPMSHSDQPLTYEDFEKVHMGPKNGSSDIYWVDAKIIHQFKPEK